MKRLIATSGLIAVWVAAASGLSAQSARMTANNEPHHKRLLYTNDVRVFDVTVPAGESVADHVHEYDMATVVIDDGPARISRNGEDAPAAGRGSVVISEQTGSPATYRIQNTGTAAYHAIEVENIREDGRWLMPALM